MSWAHEIRRGQIYSEQDYLHFIESALLADAELDDILLGIEFMISDRLSSLFRGGQELNIGEKDA
jgi:hypothetical protein